MPAENDFDILATEDNGEAAEQPKKHVKISVLLVVKYLIIAIGAIMIIWAAISLSLYWLGNVRDADLDIQRHGDSTKPEDDSKLYRYTIDYRFEATDGSIHNGSATRYAYPNGAVVGNEVYYFSFMPSINMLSDRVAPGPLQFGLIIVGGAMIFICLRKKKGRKSDGEAFLLGDGLVLPPDDRNQSNQKKQ